MSGGANKSFLANPTNWLQSNLLIVAIQEQLNTPTADLVRYPTGLVAAPRYRGGALVSCDISRHPTDTATQDKATRLAYVVKGATGTPSTYSHRFNAYYLPFFNNDFRCMLLDPTQFPPGADIFFTDSVNGCSFVAGPGVRPKVGHFNRTSGPNDMADQILMDADIGNQFAGGTVVKLRKDTYKGASISKAATVVGVRHGTAWRFYWQAREIAGYNHPTGTKWEIGSPALILCNNAG